MMQQLNFREWTIAYRRMGQGEPVVFLHNGGTSHHIWLQVMEQLQGEYDCIAVDLLGYGASSKPADAYTMDIYVDMVRTLLDTLELDRVSIVGNCMGSAIALHAARALPERFRAMVLVNPLTEATFSAGWLAGALKARKAAPGLVGGLYRGLSQFQLPRWTASSTLRFQIGRRGAEQGVHKDPTLQAQHASDGQLRSMLAVLADIDAYAEIDAPNFAEKLPPIATIWGEDNRILSAKVGKNLHQHLRPEASHALKGCGHLVMMEAPEEVADAIREHFRSTSTTQEAVHAL